VDDPPPGSTLGGLVATNASGPLRQLYGTPRDLLIGLTVVRADGVVAHSGGKVVKNVAGYDLGKLFTGSLGTLGLVTEVVFRLHPVPPAHAYLSRLVGSPAQAARLAAAVAHSQLVPAAVELDWPVADGPGMLTLLVEGHEDALADRLELAGRLLELPGYLSEPTPDPPTGWGRYPAEPHEVVLKVAYPLSELAAVLHTLRTAGAGYGLATASRGSVGSGVLHVGLGRCWEPGTVADLLGDLREALAGHGGTVIVLHAPAAVAAAVDVWGPVPALALMRRVKEQFDPEHRCSPGRYVGGI
jgi:glycolate oxidase FAD binding subunit